jgi:hypothetical protein
MVRDIIIVEVTAALLVWELDDVLQAQAHILIVIQLAYHQVHGTILVVTKDMDNMDSNSMIIMGIMIVIVEIHEMRI